MEIWQHPWDGTVHFPWSALRAQRRAYIDISEFWMEPWMGMGETGMWLSVLSMCLFRLSDSSHHIFPALLCAEQ